MGLIDPTIIYDFGWSLIGDCFVPSAEFRQIHQISPICSDRFGRSITLTECRGGGNRSGEGRGPRRREREGWNAKNLRETEREEGPIEGAKNTFRGPSTRTMMTTMRNFLELKGFVEIFINKICRHQILPNSQNCPSCYYVRSKNIFYIPLDRLRFPNPREKSGTKQNPIA